MIWLVALFVAICSAGLARDVPSPLRLRWLSEVHAQRADMMAYIASNEFKRQAPASGNFTTPNATFTLTPSAIGSAAVVTLRWQGVLNVTVDDYIGYFCSDQDDLDWMDSFMASMSSTYMQGFGELNMTLYAMRCPLTFRYFRGSQPQKALLVSNELIFNGGVEGQVPHGVRVSYGPDETTQLWLSFTTNSPTPVPFAVVNGQAYSGTTVTYEAEDLCGFPANQSRWDWFTEVGFFHHILLDKLEPGVEVLVTFGQGKYVSTTVLRPLQKRGQESDSVTFAVIGDMGIYPAPGSDTTAIVLAQMVDEEKLDFVAHVGDISYAVGHTFIWDTFHAIVEPVASRIPWLVAAGNHEVDVFDDRCYGRDGDPSGQARFFHPPWGNMGPPGIAYNDSNGEGGVPFSRRFKSPASEGTFDNGNFWYSFDLPYATVLVLSLEHDIQKGSKQFYWLKWRASLVDHRSWLIVLAHRPLYNPVVADDDKRVGDKLVEILEPLLLDAEVDVFVAGHYHSYTRTCAMRNFTCVQDDFNTRGIYHITAGNAGANLDSAVFYNGSESYVKKWIGEFGFTTITVESETHMFINSYVTRVAPNGTSYAELADHFELKRESRTDDDVSDDRRRFALAVILTFFMCLLVALAPVAMYFTKRRKPEYTQINE